VGRAERIDFPEWDLYDINAKVDTGAFTSSLHAHHIQTLNKDGEKWVRFYLLDPSHPAYNNRLFELPVLYRRVVKSSNGTTQKRYIVATNILLYGKEYPIELSLTDRSEMKYPILLGRKFLEGRFIVDVSKINYSKKYKINRS